jgi:hypothetical protein
MKSALKLLAAVVLPVITYATPLTESFVLSQSNGCCGTGPYGTVKLTQVSSTEIDFKVTLSAEDYFVQTGQAGAFAFNIDIAHPTITVSSASVGAGFSNTVLGNSTTQAEHMDNFGYFNYVIHGDSSHYGGSHPMGQLLTFSVTNAAGISFDDFDIDSTEGKIGAYFAAEILNDPGYCGTSSTGTVATGGIGLTQIATPEPATFLIAGIGLLALGLIGRNIPRNQSRR